MANITDKDRIKLHIGAHRTGTTSLQAALHGQRPGLLAQGISYWGPYAMRRKRFPGVFQSHGVQSLTGETAAKIEGIVSTNAAILAEILALKAQKGHRDIIISEENILGSMRINFQSGGLYPDAPHRLMVFSKIFGPYSSRISLTIRSYEHYWRSVIAFLLSKGRTVPTPRKLQSLATQPLRWQDVILDIRAAFPDAEIRVMPFELWVGRHEAHIEAIYGAPLSLPRQKTPTLNASLNHTDLHARQLEKGAVQAAARLGDQAGPYQPFTPAQITHMQAAYAADLAWLKQGPMPGVKLLLPGDTA